MATINYKDPATDQWVEIPTGGGSSVTVDSSLSSTSENPVQNKVINSALNGKQASLSTAQLNACNSGITSGKVSTYDSYAGQISGKQNEITSSNKLNASLVDGLSTVATSGSYNDLSNKPTIPAAANNGTLTIQKNGTNVATFGANQNTDATANITVPTKVSELTNDAGYTTNTGTVTDVKINGATKTPTSGVVDIGSDIITGTTYASDIKYGVVKIWKDSDNYLCIRTDGQ